MRRTLSKELQVAQKEIQGLAESYGLTFFPVIFELVDWNEINEIAALGGFPTRYPHWRFGMEYEYLQKTYEYGLQKIYELVINNDPCYAYLQTGNELVDQKLVMAHVFGHCDFFKNNMWFSKTNRRMLDEMANHAAKIRSLQDRLGVEKVETFIDACLSLDNLLDIYGEFGKPLAGSRRSEEEKKEEGSYAESDNFRLPSKDYLDRYINPESFLAEQRKKAELKQEASTRKFPSSPQRDVLRFLAEAAPLENWEREVFAHGAGRSSVFCAARAD